MDPMALASLPLNITGTNVSNEAVSITAEEIVTCYRLLLGRNPSESEAGMWLSFKSIPDLRPEFFGSDEFRVAIEKFGFMPEQAHAVAPGRDPGSTSDSVLFVQTADPFVCKEMLDLTSRTVIAYCQRHGFGYESFVGIKQGVVPWMATYNRIIILQELIQRGYRGWVFYLDADAFIKDMSFDTRSYISGNEGYCFIAAGGGSPTPWDINAGTFLINLGDQDGRLIAHEWLAGFNACVPADFLANPAAKRASVNAERKEYPSDQDLIYEPLQKVIHRVKKEDGLINYLDGKFIRQAIRASFDTSEARMNWLRSETYWTMRGAQVGTGGGAQRGETL